MHSIHTIEPTFRKASLADIDLLGRFIRQLYALTRIPFLKSTVRAAMAELIRKPSLGRVWVIAEENQSGQSIGYMVLTFGYSLEYGGRDAFLDELFVDAQYRGRGVGTKALDFLSAEYQKLGVRALHLEVERANATAQVLYHGAGFENHDRYLMTKRILM